MLARLLPRNAGPSRYYVAGFGALLVSGWQLSTLSEAANPWLSVMPALLCNGGFVIIVLSTTAMQTFQGVQQDDRVFSHANQVKNMLAQLGLAAGTVLATLLLQWRASLHYSRLADNLVPGSQALEDTLTQLTAAFSAAQGPANAQRLALAQIAQWLNQEATLMGALDYCFALTWLAALCLGLVLLARVLRHGLVYKAGRTA